MGDKVHIFLSCKPLDPYRLMLSRRSWKHNIIIWNLSNTHRRQTCLIGDRNASSETDMPNWRPTCLIGDSHASSDTQRRPTCPWRLKVDRHDFGVQSEFKDIHKYAKYTIFYTFCLVLNHTANNLHQIQGYPQKMRFQRQRKVTVHHFKKKWMMIATSFHHSWY